MNAALYESELHSLPLLHRGKVRDIYAAGPEHLLLVASDRLSAFDVVLPDPIPGKGAVLTGISKFWFEHTRHIIANHVAGQPLDEIIHDRDELALLAERAMLVRKLEALPVEAVVRGYLIGSGWKDYQKTGAVCGIELPRGLRLADPLPQPIFTPATKAPKGHHDENISFDKVANQLGHDIAAQVRSKAIELYNYAARHARERGIIIADTKFEFGLDRDRHLILIDEALTPDSSRFWPAASYRPGVNPPSFDKQYVRDYLETLDWNKKAPGPHLPPEIIARTTQKYREAWRRLTE